jgi:cellulose synthase/poly-beta-1,6-N-acetylglucosamine synthase-like glycosyltransferase
MTAGVHAPPVLTTRPLLSVVVIGRNEGERLSRCLASVAAMRQDEFRIEILYVDSGSTDGSLARASAAGARTIPLQPERPSAALGRNAGWLASEGEFILFLDGDTVLDPEFVALSLPEFAAPEVAVVWGHRRELHPGNSLYNRVLDLDWIYPPGWTSFCGGDALFRRIVLVETNGFDETLIAGEEPELCRRILGRGGKILHVDRLMTGHDLAITRWGQYWRRATRAGHAFAEVSERFRATENPFWLDASQGNEQRALALALTAIAGLASLLLLRSCWPLILVCLLFLSLATRSAWKARWKSSDWLTLMLYGMHAHVQQIPIYVGQLQYRRSRETGKRMALIEYNK